MCAAGGDKFSVAVPFLRINIVIIIIDNGAALLFLPRSGLCTTYKSPTLYSSPLDHIVEIGH